MATKGEISAAILRGNRDVEQVFGGLTDTQLDTPVHQGEGTWTAGDILGHLAGREQVYAMMFQAARGDNPFAAISDFNAWNEERVAERRGEGRDDLLAEFRAVHEALLAQVEATDDAELGQVISLGRRTASLGDLLRGSGGQHSTTHATEVASALGVERPEA
jgi:uncharacterized damage-inducible protein DinB